MNINNHLSAELKSLKAISQKARKALKGAPEEALVCSRSNGVVRENDCRQIMSAWYTVQI